MGVLSVDRQDDYDETILLVYWSADELVWSILINNLGSNNFKPTPEWDSNTPDSPNSPFSFTFSKNKNPRNPPQDPPSSPPSSFSFQMYDSNLKTLFRILNLNSTSSLREVRRAYYLIARKYHLDKWNGEVSNISKAKNEERFKRILNTFEDLKLANLLA